MRAGLRVDVEPSKTVLLVTYAFPPVAYVGVYRSLKYCKYLGTLGWRPIVLTARPHPKAHQDPELCEEIPEWVAVHRTADVDLAKWTPPWRRWRRSRARTSAPNGSSVVSARPSILGKLKRTVFRILMESPDSHWSWIPFGLIRGAAILARHRVDVIYCSSPPHSSHVIAFALARIFRKPLVLDFRDPWVVMHGQQDGGPPGERLLARVQTAVKRVIVQHARAVICVSPGELAEIRREFPELPAERFVCITNGFDENDTSAIGRVAARNERLTLLHAGTIYPGTADEFFDALLQLTRNTPNVANRIRVNLLGSIADEYLETVRELEAAHVVRAHGLVTHQTALRMMHESDVLLILLGGGVFPSSEIPAKSFEYLRAGRAILGIAPEGDLADMIRQSGLGTIVPPHRADRVVAALHALIDEHLAGGPRRTPNREFISRFERRALTRRLVEVLDQVSDQHTSHHADTTKWTSVASR